MTVPTWKALSKRVQALYDGGEPLIDVDGSRIPGDHARPPVGYVRDYSFRIALPELREITRRVELKLYQQPEAGGVIRRLDRMLSLLADKPLFAASELQLSDFAQPEDDDGYFDVVMARDGFNTLVRWLLKEVEALAARPESPQLPHRAAREDEEYWSRERLADFLGYERADSVTKDIWNYKQKHGEDPPWVERLPGKQRSFKVRAKVFLQEMKSGRAKQPRAYRY